MNTNSNIREKLFEYSNNSNIHDNTGVQVYLIKVIFVFL